MHYLDHNATTRVAPEVVEAMVPCFTEQWGNPSSAYRFGREVAKRVEAAREQVATLIGAEPSEIVFTSCGTESIHTALHSATATQPDRRHLIATAVEHSATLQACDDWRRRGYEVNLVPVHSDGALDLGHLERALRTDTALVSVMLANNETGVLFPVREVAALCRSRGVLCHTDAVQAAGKVPIDVHALGVDFLSLSAHKLYAPKGIAALYVRRGTRFEALLGGGHQEHGRRGGTENVPYIVGFGRAAELALAHLKEVRGRIGALRDRLEQSILTTIPNVTRNGAVQPRLPNTANLAFAGVEAEALLLRLDQLGICASSGSACTAGSPEPSHVLVAMNVPLPHARASLRLSLGRDNTDEDVDVLLRTLPSLVAELRTVLPGGLGAVT